VTILVSTHHLDEATRCQRIALLRLGALLAVDTPAALRQMAGADDFEQAFLYFARRQGGTTTALTPALVGGGRPC
jgi:ABC-2 type transport system ATP-binding protein